MRVGILTMHRVLNHGSALQAYALQKKVSDMGYTCELIDYIYPYKLRQSPLKLLFTSVFAFIRDACVGFAQTRKRKKFKTFYKDNFVLTPETYDRQGIVDNPPMFDLYLSGSDQVWNPRFIGDDVNFMLAFTPDNALRMSYASSFATRTIEPEKKELFSKYLSRYDAISVRESSGVHLVKELTGKDAVLCCDPTLLLGKNEWDRIAGQSSYRIKEKYILVHVLFYMFDPYPYIYDIVEKVQKELGYKAIYLVGRTQDAFRPNSTLIKSAGPADFAYLFKNAGFVITSSFHGTAFALINDKPLLGVVDTKSNQDSRIQSLLESVSAHRCILDYKGTVELDSSALLRLKGDQKALSNLIHSSESFLKNGLSSLTDTCGPLS